VETSAIRWHHLSVYISSNCIVHLRYTCAMVYAKSAVYPLILHFKQWLLPLTFRTFYQRLKWTLSGTQLRIPANTFITVPLTLTPLRYYTKLNGRLFQRMDHLQMIDCASPALLDFAIYMTSVQGHRLDKAIWNGRV